MLSRHAIAGKGLSTCWCDGQRMRNGMTRDKPSPMVSFIQEYPGSFHFSFPASLAAERCPLLGRAAPATGRTSELALDFATGKSSRCHRCAQNDPSKVAVIHCCGFPAKLPVELPRTCGKINPAILAALSYKVKRGSQQSFQGP